MIIIIFFLGGRGAGGVRRGPMSIVNFSLGLLNSNKQIIIVIVMGLEEEWD